MDILASLLDGFGTALSLTNLLYVLMGVILGTFIGALPGFGPATAIAMLLPITFTLPPDTAIILLAGIYYGGMFGGRIPAILLNMPGDAPSVVTTFEGYPMAKAGRAGPALTLTAMSSSVGGLVGVLALAFLAPPLAELALRFGPPEITLLALLGILLISQLGAGSMIKSLVAAGAGIVVASIGQDPLVGTQRMTLGFNEFLGGVSFVAAVMGVFGLAEIFYSVEKRVTDTTSAIPVGKVWPSRDEWRLGTWPTLRGSGVGLLIGMAPGAGAEIASMTSYAMEKKRAKEPQRFNNGAVEGLAGPEAANNSAAVGSFVPLLTLGIPGSVTTALIFGALLLQGITPGPTLISAEPKVFFGLIVSMFIGNILLLFINVPLVGVFVSMLRIRFEILSAIVVALLIIGAYSLNNTMVDVWVMVFFGVVGYIARKTGFSMGPFALAFVLSPIMERSLRRSLVISDSGFSIFLQRPASLVIIALAVLVFVVPPLLKRFRPRRKSLLGELERQQEVANRNDTES